MALRRLRGREVEARLLVERVPRQELLEMLLGVLRLSREKRRARPDAISEKGLARPDLAERAVDGRDRLILASEALVGLRKPLERGRKRGVGADSLLESGSRSEVVSGEQALAARFVSFRRSDGRGLGGGLLRSFASRETEFAAEPSRERADEGEESFGSGRFGGDVPARKPVRPGANEAQVDAQLLTRAANGPGDEAPDVPEIGELLQRRFVVSARSQPQVVKVAKDAERVEDAQLTRLRKVRRQHLRDPGARPGEPGLRGVVGERQDRDCFAGADGSRRRSARG